MIENIPTNIITGFLGTGKTSAILHLLKSKPEGERWAVIVNEFGEVGLDGDLFQSSFTEDEGVFIRTVPGGCMCCSSNLPMQVALAVLLKKSRPHRLLIEPSGLGHPKEVMALLFSKYYQGVLNVEKTLTLFDPRHLDMPQYISHPTFKQQIDIADVLIANKSDLCTESQLSQIVEKIEGKLEDKIKYRREAERFSNKPVYSTQFGQIDMALLSGKTSFKLKTKENYKEQHTQPETQSLNEIPIPDEAGFLMSTNSGEGYKSIGWRYQADYIFSKQSIMAWLNSFTTERLKAIIHTDEGLLGLNYFEGTVQETEIKKSNETRIEIIAKHIDDSWHEKLNSCIISGYPTE